MARSPARALTAPLAAVVLLAAACAGNECSAPAPAPVLAGGEIQLVDASVPGLCGEAPGLPSTAVRMGSVTDLRVAGRGPGTDDGMVRLAARRGTLTALAVLPETPSADEAAHLLAACGPGSGQVAIVLGELPGARWRWNAEADGRVRLPEVGVTVTAPSR